MNARVPSWTKYFYAEFHVFKNAQSWGDAWVTAEFPSVVDFEYVCWNETYEWRECAMWGMISPQPNWEELQFEFDVSDAPVFIDIVYFGTHCQPSTTPAVPTTWGRVKSLFADRE
jgi:hypothetical protein